jgi:hypothetical protein
MNLPYWDGTKSLTRIGNLLGEVMAASSRQDRNTIRTRSFLVISAGLLEDTKPAQQSRGTRTERQAYSSMTHEKPTDKTENESAPLLLAAVANHGSAHF